MSKEFEAPLGGFPTEAIYSKLEGEGEKTETYVEKALATEVSESLKHEREAKRAEEEMGMTEKQIVDHRIRKIKDRVKPSEDLEFGNLSGKEVVYAFDEDEEVEFGSKADLQEIIELAERDKACKKSTINSNDSKTDFYKFSNGMVFVVFERKLFSESYAGYFEDMEVAKRQIEERADALEQEIEAHQKELASLDRFLPELEG